MATTISRSDRVTTRRRLRALLLGTAILSVGPVGVGAQATSLGASPAREVPPTTHTVKRGDTLWDLAARYLANPFRWPEISGRNTTLIQDPDLIEPGWVLVIAGEPLSAAGAGRPMPRATDVDSAAAGARGASQGVPPMAATPPRVIGGDPASRWAARRREAERVPYLVGLGGIEGAGWIVLPQARNVSGMPATAPGLVQLYDRVRLVLPKGSAVAPGMTLLTLRSGPTLKGIGRVAIPTGLLRVISDSAGGIAELVTMFDQVDADQRVVPAWSAPAVTDSVPVRVSAGPTTAVLWIAGDALLPAPGAAILLSRGSGEGLRVGDQVTLGPQDRPARGRASMPEPVDIAVAQVVRVTRAGASAVLLSQVDGAIAVGMTGRVTARLP
ncbi:MAG: LysM peptidoglycan-binding domain-containing protein [Gemmatimonadota bacterium]|jgi:hypothetical protein|nr:LysM peptidoglycan-binding domain-containing protein [Gemmatimonadota bacterium]